MSRNYKIVFATIACMLLLYVLGSIWIVNSNKQESGATVGLYDKEKGYMGDASFNRTGEVTFIKTKLTVENTGNVLLKCGIKKIEPSAIESYFNRKEKIIPSVLLTKRTWESDFIAVKELKTLSQPVEIRADIICTVLFNRIGFIEKTITTTLNFEDTKK